MRKIELMVELDVSHLAASITEHLNYDDAFFLIKAIDDIFCDSAFTERLNNHFHDLMQELAEDE